MTEKPWIEMQVPYEVGKQLQEHSDRHQLGVFPMQDSTDYKVLVYISPIDDSCAVCHSTIGPFEGGTDVLCGACWNKLPWLLRYAWLSWMISVVSVSAYAIMILR